MFGRGRFYFVLFVFFVVNMRGAFPRNEEPGDRGDLTVANLFAGLG